MRQLEAVEPWITARRAQGRVRECHGDLHARNVIRHQGHLMAFDCVEFEPAFRWIDVADETALLLTDLEARGHLMHAHAFWGGYLESSGDFQSHRVLDLYKAHRALVRAKVAALSCAIDGPAIRSRRLARGAASAHRRAHATRCGRARPCCCSCAACPAPARPGLPSSWRRDCSSCTCARMWSASVLWASARWRTRAPRCSRDCIRRQPRARCTRDWKPARTICSPVATARWWMRPLRGAPIVPRFRALAARLGVSLQLIHCHAAPTILRARIAERRRAAADASEADESVLSLANRPFRACWCGGSPGAHRHRYQRPTDAAARARRTRGRRGHRHLTARRSAVRLSRISRRPEAAYNLTPSLAGFRT